jgi:hypothetical protein
MNIILVGNYFSEPITHKLSEIVFVFDILFGLH